MQIRQFGWAALIAFAAATAQAQVESSRAPSEKTSGSSVDADGKPIKDRKRVNKTGTSADQKSASSNDKSASNNEKSSATPSKDPASTDNLGDPAQTGAISGAQGRTQQPNQPGTQMRPR